MERITHGLCWSHVRRKYIDSIPLDSSGKEIPGSKGAEARELIDQLFYIEGLVKDLPKECYRINNPEKDEESFDHSENI